jgi:hypothetical protein
MRVATSTGERHGSHRGARRAAARRGQRSRSPGWAQRAASGPVASRPFFLACDTQQVRTGSGRDWLAAVAMLLAAASWGGLLILLSL